jgi:hypothetical protein
VKKIRVVSKVPISTHIRIERQTLSRLRADRRPGEETDSDIIARLLETQKKVDVVGLGAQ